MTSVINIIFRINILRKGVSRMAMGSNHKKRHNIPIYLACLLLCLTLISIHFSSGLYAKYTTTVSGSDSARVIKFGDITLTESDSSPITDDQKFVIIPGVTIKKNPLISFAGSEAMTYIFVEIEVSSHWDYALSDDKHLFTINTDQLRWQVSDGWTYLKKEGSNTYVFYRLLAPNVVLVDASVISEGQIQVSSGITASDLTYLTSTGNPYINVRAMAVQGNGFDSATDAWNAVSAP